MAYRYRPGKSRERSARARLITKYGKRCMQCGYDGNIELHHKKRIVDGGGHDEDNLILLCEKCHAEAHGHTKKKYIDAGREFWRGGN